MIIKPPKIYDLSVLIPARRELYLNRTVQSVQKSIRGNTEIIVVMDEEWDAGEGLVGADNVTIIKTNKAIGQRAATNLAARASKARFIMKLDAHSDLAEGFDVELMNSCKYNQIMIPAQWNLHAFNWRCKKCGSEWYQGPTPEHCMVQDKKENRTINPNCDNTTEFEKKMLWKKRKQTLAWYFDKALHFQYWGEYTNRPEFKQQDIVPVMSCLGACWFLHREYYWELDGLDEAHGSWGQMGTELACKTWLYGGEMVVNKRTWFAHLFRTQGKDFGFPYEITSKETDHARKYSQNLWLNDKWPKAKHSLQWLIEKFRPIPDWHTKQTTSVHKPSKGVLYYTDNQLNDPLFSGVQKQILKGIKEKHVVSVSLQPIKFGQNYVLSAYRGYLTMAKQILQGLEALKSDIVYFCEHDVLYHPSHFAFIPEKPDRYYYNTNVWRVRQEDGFSVKVDDCRQLSGLVAYRETLLTHYKKRVELLEKAQQNFNSDKEFNLYVRLMGFEPGTHGRPEKVDDLKSEVFHSEVANLDIRHDKNLTPSRWSKDQFRNERYTRGWTEAYEVPGWGNTKQVLETL